METLFRCARVSVLLKIVAVQLLAYVGSMPAAAQTTTVLPLPGLYGTWGNANQLQLANYRLTIGDLDGNGVPDVVLSNAVAYLKVYLLRYSISNNLEVMNNFTILDYPAVCSTTGDGARMLSVNPWAIDTPLIYDIDLDGLNELIYLKHMSSGTSVGQVFLTVYEYNGTAFVEQSNLSLVGSGTHDLVTMCDPTQPYFAANCPPIINSKPEPQAINLVIANVRGRAYPQDILVYAHDEVYAEGLWVYGYDTNGGTTPTLTRLFKHDTTVRVTGYDDRIFGLQGHNWRALDIDYDGIEEVIGKHVLAYDPSTQTKSIKWGIVLNGSEPPMVMFWSDPPAINSHPDHIAGLDFIQNYLDEVTGLTIPAPGLEILVAADTVLGSAPKKPDNSGPWIYRAISGHSLATTYPRVWPRRLVNLNQLGNDGAKYMWASTSTMVKQPAPDTAANPSNWDNVIDDLKPTNNFNARNPDIQLVLPGDLVYDLGGGSTDLHPGPELLASSKTDLVPAGCGGDVGHTYFLFDSTTSLAALAWGEETTSLSARTPGIQKAVLLDFINDRNQVESYFATGVGCMGATTAQEVFSFEPDSMGGAKRYKPVSKYQRAVMSGESLGTSDGSTGADLDPVLGMGDSREEIVAVRVADAVGSVFQTTELLIVNGPALSMGVTRNEPSPWKFLDYRRRVYTCVSYSQHVDYKQFSGLRCYAHRNLPKGKTGVQYGRSQDQKLVGSLPPAQQKGTAIIAEGGVPPYIYSITKGGLPSGLASTTLSLATGDNQVYWIYGTPLEHGIIRFTLQVTDSTMPIPKTHSSDFWMDIKLTNPAPPGTIQNRAPRITAGGFDGVFVKAGITMSAPVEAFVTDPNNNVTTVEVLDASDMVVANLTDTDGDNVWTGSVNTSGMLAAQTRAYKMIAKDATNRTSLAWPYLVIDGGTGQFNPAFQPVGTVPPASQESVIPTIDRVQVLSNNIEPGEVSDATGKSVSLTVFMKDRKGLNVVKVEAIIRNHSSPDRTYSAALDPPADPMADSYTLTISNLPSAEFGWGYHSLNVRVTTQDSMMNMYSSDWWPQLTAH